MLKLKLKKNPQASMSCGKSLLARAGEVSENKSKLPLNNKGQTYFFAMFLFYSVQYDFGRAMSLWQFTLQ